MTMVKLVNVNNVRQFVQNVYHLMNALHVKQKFKIKIRVLVTANNHIILIIFKEYA